MSIHNLKDDENGLKIQIEWLNFLFLIFGHLKNFMSHFTHGPNLLRWYENTFQGYSIHQYERLLFNENREVEDIN